MSENEQPPQVTVDKNISRESIEKLIARLKAKETPASTSENQQEPPKESTTEK